MKFKLLALTLSVPVCFASIAASDNDFFTPEKVSADISFGSLSGKTKERVYDPQAGGRKLSQLDWKYNNAAIIKGAFDWDLMPWVSLGASGWTTLAHRGANMRDRDWLDDSRDTWTDQSNHPDTRLNYANEFDVHLKGWLLNEPDYRLGIMAGYQETRYSFKATGGNYNYTDENTGLPDIGSFPSGVTVIGYKQRYKVPYIGLTGSYRYERIEFGATFKYSGWVRSTDSDQHYLRTTTFNDRFKQQNFYSLAANVGYHVTSQAKVYVEGVWNRTTNKKGSVTTHDYVAGTQDNTANSSGLENYNLIATVGLKYTF